MRVFTLLLFIALSMNLFAQGNVKKPINKTDFAFEYRGTNKQISIRDLAVRITEQNPVFDNPVSAIPSRTNPTTRNITLTDNQLVELKKIIETSGFMTLPESQYGAPKTERSYPQIIKILFNGKMKSVMYRSHPNYGACPEAFTKVETFVNQLIK